MGTTSGRLGAVTNVFYFVADLQAAREWYSWLLGDEPVEIQPQLVTFLVGGTRLTLHLSDDFNQSAGLLGTVAYWSVADVDDVAAQCVARGAVAHRGPKTIFTGERLCQLEGPCAGAVVIALAGLVATLLVRARE